MNEALASYFEGEKSAGLALAAIGLLMAGAAGAFLSLRAQPKAFAYTLLVWAALELAVGVGLYVKTDPQVARLASLLADQPAEFYESERPRMATVQRNFVVLEGVWLVVIIASAVLAVWQKAQPAVSGIALGMLVNTAVLLVFDIMAERRGSTYFDRISVSGPRSTP